MSKLEMRAMTPRRDESGMALITTLLVMTLISALVAGTFAAVTADQRANMSGRDQTQVFAAAHAALEKLTADLAALFASDVSPGADAIDELATRPPDFGDEAGIEFEGPAGDGYTIDFDRSPNPNPVAQDITVGPWEGFKGLITTYDMEVTARSAHPGGAEVKLKRQLQTVAIPAFQFGVFSETDQTFYAGDDFGFGGRVHTNGNLFLSELYGHTLTFSDRITAVGDIVRANLSNGRTISSVWFTGTVRVPSQITPTLQYRALASNEGSVQGMPGSTPTSNWGSWSDAHYHGALLNSSNGAKPLKLPLASQGAEPIDLIRRPRVDSDEDDENPAVFGQRYFATASVRILLSDRPEDILGLPTVTSTAPVRLDGTFGPGAGHPIARSFGNFTFQTHSSTSSTYSSGVATIMVASVPAELQMPTLTFDPPGSTPPTLSGVVCGGRNANQFLRCNISGLSVATLPSGTLISGIVDGATVTAVTSGSTSRSSSATVTITGSTAGFAPRLSNYLWATDSTGTTPIWCSGYDNGASPPRLTGCSGLSAAPARGSDISTHAHETSGTPLIGGFIKVELQSSSGTWTDVTDEILELGIGAPNQQSGSLCADPTPDAVLRIQRLRDNGGSGCTYAGSTSSQDWWPNTLYDAREGNHREVGTTAPIVMGGVMHYIALDVGNLKRWLSGDIPGMGDLAWDNNGYIVYFSDRRGNHNWDLAGLPETGEYGWEDVVNPADAEGDPNGTLQAGEDVNASGTLQTYGAAPQTLVTASATAPFNSAQANPRRQLNAGQARVNRTVLFRRALKLVNGGIVSGDNRLPTSGLTIASENPVYVQGNYNATTSPTAEPNVPAAIIADAVTLLSNDWKDSLSFRNPNNRDLRPARTTAFRFAVIAGKNRAFPHPDSEDDFLFGTDGGAGNFLRLLEDWNLSGVSINYRGSIISLYYSRQATGTFKYNTNVYDYGVRNFTFDTDFLNPALLPPGTPMFRDINILTFRQMLRPDS
jgi:hypothetical protein